MTILSLLLNLDVKTATNSLMLIVEPAYKDKFVAKIKKVYEIYGRLSHKIVHASGMNKINGNSNSPEKYNYKIVSRRLTKLFCTLLN